MDVLEQWIGWALGHLPDALIYGGIVLVTLFAALRCFLPVARNARALRRAARVVSAEAKLQLARPSWNDLHFLGSTLQNNWASFLQNAELMDVHGEPCDVEDYINEDTVIYNAANSALADLVPGVLVSLGILGTFLGITMGLQGLALQDSSAIARAIQTLIGGMSVAFLTSICGIVASIIFNFVNRYVQGRAKAALAHFLDVFQQYAMPKPPDADVKMLVMQQEQNNYLRTFVEEVSLRTAAQMEQAILRALLPVQRSMDNFIVATTREQVEGMDRIAARFVERMNLALDGQFKKLWETLAQVNTGNQRAQADMQTVASAIGSISQDVLATQGQSQQLFAQMEGYLRQVDAARREADATGQASAELLENMHSAAVEQAKYLAKLQEYQAALQGSLQQYTLWTDKFLTNAQRQSDSTNKALERLTGDMQDSAALLQSAYASFVENIQAGLAKALSMTDEHITGATKGLNASLAGVQAAVQDVPTLMASSARKYGAQVEQFVSALAQLQRSMQGFSQALDAQPKQPEEVG
jgi:hypothetical protein